jgi:hypothetical protein
MSLQLKTEIEQTIGSYVKGIYPPVESANLTISFVPIVKNPLDGRKQGVKVVMEGSSYETAYIQREYVEGFYVTRLKVNPTVPERLYFWSNDKQPVFPLKVNGKITAASGCRIGRLIKHRFKDYYVP